MKAPEVGGAGVPAVLKEGQPGPHPGAPLRPTGSVPGSGLNIPDVPGKDMEPGIQISLRACGEPAFLRVVRASFAPAVDPTCFPRSPSRASGSGFKKEIATVIMDKARTQRVCWMASCGYGITGLMGLRMSFLQKKGLVRGFLWLHKKVV